MKHKYPFLECRYEKNEEGKYYLVTSDLSNIIKSVPSRYLLPLGNPGFNHENLTQEIEILRNLDSYLQRSDFQAIKRIYDLTDNFNSLEDGPEKYEIGNKLVNDLEHEFKLFYSKHTGASPVREYFANEEYIVVKNYILANFLNKNPDGLGKVNVLLNYSLHLTKETATKLIESFNEEDYELLKKSLSHMARFLPPKYIEVYIDGLFALMKNNEKEAINIFDRAQIAMDTRFPRIVNHAIIFDNVEVIKKITDSIFKEENKIKYDQRVFEIIVLHAFFRGNLDSCKHLLSDEVWSLYTEDNKKMILEIINSRFTPAAKREMIELLESKRFYPKVSEHIDQEDIYLRDQEILERSIRYFQGPPRIRYEDNSVGQILLTPNDGTITREDLLERSKVRNIFSSVNPENYKSNVKEFKKRLVSAWEQNNYSHAILERLVPDIKADLISGYLTAESSLLRRFHALDTVEMKRAYSEFIRDTKSLSPLVKILSPNAMECLPQRELNNIRASLSKEEKDLFKLVLQKSFFDKNPSYVDNIYEMVFGGKDYNELIPTQTFRYNVQQNDEIGVSANVMFLRYSTAFGLVGFTKYFIDQLTNNSFSERLVKLVSNDIANNMIYAINAGDKNICKEFLRQDLFNNFYTVELRAQLVHSIITRSGLDTRDELLEYLSKSIMIADPKIHQQVLRMADNRGEFEEVAPIIDLYTSRSQEYLSRLNKIIKLRDEAPDNLSLIRPELINKQERYGYLAVIFEDKSIFINENQFNKYLRSNIEIVRENRCTDVEIEEYFGLAAAENINLMNKIIDDLEKMLAKESKKHKNKGKNQEHAKSSIADKTALQPQMKTSVNDDKDLVEVGAIGKSLTKKEKHDTKDKIDEVQFEQKALKGKKHKKKGKAQESANSTIAYETALQPQIDTRVNEDKGSAEVGVTDQSTTKKIKHDAKDKVEEVKSEQKLLRGNLVEDLLPSFEGNVDRSEDNAPWILVDNKSKTNKYKSADSRNTFGSKDLHADKATIALKQKADDSAILKPSSSQKNVKIASQDKITVEENTVVRKLEDFPALNSPTRIVKENLVTKAEREGNEKGISENNKTKSSDVRVENKEKALSLGGANPLRFGSDEISTVLAKHQANKERPSSPVSQVVETLKAADLKANKSFVEAENIRRQQRADRTSLPVVEPDKSRIILTYVMNETTYFREVFYEAMVVDSNNVKMDLFKDKDNNSYARLPDVLTGNSVWYSFNKEMGLPEIAPLRGRPTDIKEHKGNYVFNVESKKVNTAIAQER